MLTTIDLDGDVLLAAKELARQRGVTVGKVISDLARHALTRSGQTAWAGTTRAGIPLFPIRGDGGPITLELVNRLRDETS